MVTATASHSVKVLWLLLLLVTVEGAMVTATASHNVKVLWLLLLLVTV